MRTQILTGLATIALLVSPGLPSVWADESHGGMRGHERGHDKGDAHESAGHYIRHLLKHPKEIGLTPDQVAKLKAIQLELNKTRIRAEAEIEVAELELATMVADEKADMAAIENKVKQSENMEVGLRMAAIKAKREATALLSPEQREKEKAEHEKMMQQRSGGMMGGMGGGMMGGMGGGPRGGGGGPRDGGQSGGGGHGGQ